MATFLDIGLLKFFSSIFPFLFMLVIVWAILLRAKLFGDNKAFAAMTAFLLAVVTMLSPIAVKTINLMAPWFVLFFIAIIFVLLVYQAFGIKEEIIMGVITGSEYGTDIGWAVFAIGLTIILGSLFTVLSEEKIQFRPPANVSIEAQTPLQYGVNILTHPKVLGFMVIMLLAVFTMQRLLAKES